MLADSLFMALGGIAGIVLLLIAVYIYLALIRQISARGETAVTESVREFGLPEAILAWVLISFLVVGVAGSFSGQTLELNSRIVIMNLVVELAVVLSIVAVLRFRGFSVNSLAGFSRISFRRVLGSGIVLLLAAYPLVSLAEIITQGLLGGGSSQQSIVELFSASRTIQQRITIIVFAIAIAPMAEEFLFRFFLYGVLRRYSGRFFGIAINALLFAAAHAHLPSFAPLLVLGICLTIAYEWSGSILVSMTMHSLFNSLSLIVLAFPELFQQ